MGQSESTAVNDENVTHLPIKKENALKNILFVDESNDLSKDTLTTKLKVSVYIKLEYSIKSYSYSNSIEYLFKSE